MSLMPRSRGGALWRFAIAAVIVIGFTAATTAVAGLLQFKQFAADLALSPAINHAAVTIPQPGAAQTILVIGSDHRAGEPFSASNTDTMMLIRLDPNSATINVISVPRDLEVRLPQGGSLGPGKLNSAYSIGGPNLLVKTLRTQVFRGLHVNHIVDVNFGGFQDLVNAIGCVYADVDHRYYNNTALTNYSSINIQPGYQKLCGADALSFVRFRHTDSDIVRNARQQDFVRWAKAQYSVTQLLSNRDKLLKIFGKHTQTDPNLHTVDGLINLFNLVAFSDGHSIKQVPFPAILLPCNPAPGAQTPCYVGASAAAERRAFATFLRPTTAQQAKGSSGPSVSGQRHAASTHVGGLSADVNDGRQQAAAIGNPGFPVYYPRLIQGPSQYCSGAAGNCPLEVASPGSYPRSYELRDQRRHVHHAYRMTLVINPVLGQYYGVEGMNWQNPPILASPTETKTVGGKKLDLYANGGKINLVAWHTPQAVYWISNTLTDEISNQQMVAIAASLTRG